VAAILDFLAVENFAQEWQSLETHNGKLHLKNCCHVMQKSACAQCVPGSPTLTPDYFECIDYTYIFLQKYAALNTGINALLRCKSIVL